MSYQWRIARKCSDCPFHKSGQGRKLRDSLGPGRWRGILSDLRNGLHFHCHRTVEWTEGDGEDIPIGINGKKKLVCAGSIEYEDSHGIKSQLRQIGERLGIIECPNESGAVVALSRLPARSKKLRLKNCAPSILKLGNS
jgi:hypothetical protein